MFHFEVDGRIEKDQVFLLHFSVAFERVLTKRGGALKRLMIYHDLYLIGPFYITWIIYIYIYNSYIHI